MKRVEKKNIELLLEFEKQIKKDAKSKSNSRDNKNTGGKSRTN